MRIEAIEYEVYTFSELSEKAKEKVRTWYLDGREAFIFTEDCENYLMDKFHNSDLKVEYSLNYCQGDGLNIYGDIDLMDLYENILKENPDTFTEKERKFMVWVLCNYGTDYSMPGNYRYGYCMSSRWDFTEDIISNMEWDNMRNIKYSILEKFNKAAIDFMEKICSDLEKWGYEYFYEISDEDLEDSCSVNGYEFLADGTIF